MSDNELLDMGGAAITMAEIAGFSFDETPTLVSHKFPKGVYVWAIEETVMEQRTETAKAPGDADKKVIRLNVKCVCKAVVHLAEKFDGENEELIDKPFTNSFRVDTANTDLLVKGFGYWKGFLTKAGFAGTGNYNEIFEASKGLLFVGKLTKSRNPNDEDNPYINMDNSSVRPFEEQAT